ncbi:MAG: ABC transporter permease [Nitrososphaerales archaeon]
MTGTLTVAGKELSDYLGTKRFWFFFAIIYVAGLAAAYLGIQGLVQARVERSFLLLFRATTGVLPPFLFFTLYFGPLLGVALGFDSINKERAKNTLVRLLSNPVHRDSVVNGKFLSGVVIVGLSIFGILGIASGLAIRVGLVPNLDELARLVVFGALTVLYIAGWLALSQLLSILFTHTSTSAIAGFAIWGFFTFFWTPIASLVAANLIPDPSSLERISLEQNLSRISPSVLYLEAVLVILTPTARFLNPVSLSELQYVIPNPLPLLQSINLIWSHIIALIGMVLVCFLLSYIIFVKQEIRT